LIDDGGRILFQRAADKELPNASTTKMVTALVVARAGGLDDTVTVSQHAAGTGEGGFDLVAGESYTVLDLLYALLLSSSNDAAVALAEHVAGSEDAFVARMNDLVARLGLHRTRFATPHGLDAPRHYSSARDLARIATALLEHEDLAEVVATRTTTVATPGGPERIENTNPLLKGYRGAVGVKTGSTEEAGDVLAAAAVRNGRRLVAVALGSKDASRDAARLLDYGFARLSRTVLVERGTVVGHLVFDPAGSVGAATTRSVRGLARPGEVDIRFQPDGDLELPVKEGDVVGAATVVASGEVVRTVEVRATSTLGSHQTQWVGAALGDLLRLGSQLAGLIP
jgi:D-alanyl-D-alanine carboxypeptidase